MMPENNQGENRNANGDWQPGWFQQNMKEQNVDDDRSEQHQPERGKSARQEQRAANQLERTHDIEIMADE